MGNQVPEGSKTRRRKAGLGVCYGNSAVLYLLGLGPGLR